MNGLIDELRIKIVEQLKLQDILPENIDPDEELFNPGSGLGLDSIDILELIVLLQQDYGIKIRTREEGLQVFRSVRTIAQYITDNR